MTNSEKTQITDDPEFARIQGAIDQRQKDIAELKQKIKEKRAESRNLLKTLTFLKQTDLFK